MQPSNKLFLSIAAVIAGAIFLFPSLVSAANSAPVLDATKTPVLGSIAEDAGVPSGTVGTSVTSLVDDANTPGGLDNAVDVDSGTVFGIAVISINSSLTCYYSIDNGTSWSAFGSVSGSSARLLSADPSSRIYCTPTTANANGVFVAAITFRVWDQTSGTDGDTFDATTTGGTTSFSSVTDTADITVTPVNDAPILNTSRTPTMVSAQSFGGAPSGAVGTPVISLVDFVIPTGGLDNVSDVDSGPQLGISIFSVNPSLTCYYSTDSGTSWNPLGSPSHVSSRLLAANATNRIYCSGPSGNFTNALGMRAWDRTSGVDGDTMDDSSNGGSSSLSLATDNVSLNIAVTGDFITTWKTDNAGTSTDHQITIPATGGGNNFDVDWGDSTTSTGQVGSVTHTYADIGTYTVRITGTFSGIFFGFGGDKLKLLSVEQWGTDTEWSTMSGAFFGCSNLEINATDAPDLSSVVDMQYALRGTSALGSADLSNWNVSNVANFVGTFQDSSFNGDISSWVMGSATNTSAMFYNDTFFNQDIGGWNMGSATDMNSMFYHDTAFNQDLGDWNIIHAINMSNMFSGDTLSTSNYDATLTGWNETAPHSIVFNGGSSKFCEFASRNFLAVSNSWTISDGGPDDCGYTLDAVTNLHPRVHPGDLVFTYSTNSTVHNALSYNYGSMIADVPDCKKCNVTFDLNAETLTLNDLVFGDSIDIEFYFKDNNNHVSNSLEVGPFEVISNGAGGASSKAVEQFMETNNELPLSGTTASGININRTLKYKMTGDDVMLLQKYLNTHGFILAASGVGSPGKETNYFGLLTVKAVKAFQSAHGLTPDGIVGPITRSYLK